MTYLIGNSMKKAAFFLGISVIWTAAAGPIQPAEMSDEDWAAAARISLASAHRGQPVIVFDENLSPAGIQGLRRVRSAVSISDLNDRDEASQNPQVVISSFAYSQQRLLATTGVLFGYQSQPGR
jgi:hypothetical protein